MDKRKVPRFMDHPVHQIMCNSFINSNYSNNNKYYQQKETQMEAIT